jgi:hypothetical protein
MSDMTGGCLCGRVRYVVTGEPMRSGLCHCRDCQRYTGSAFEPWLLLATDQVSLHGDMKTFDMTGGSGQVIHRHFCANCGSGVVNEVDVLPGTIIVLAGTLDDPTVFVPTVEIYCSAAQPWANDGRERQRYPMMLPLT